MVCAPFFLSTMSIFRSTDCEIEGCLIEGLIVPSIAKRCEAVWLVLNVVIRSSQQFATKKNTRAVAAMLRDAVGQIPAGERGIIYACFQEGAAAGIADERAERIKQETANWYHRWGISVPASFISRFFLRASGDGRPDLIVNSLTLNGRSVHTSIVDLFPDCIFTKA